MGLHEGETPASLAQMYLETMNLLSEPELGRRKLSTRQHRAWRPPTDVYETDESIMVKVEIAGMQVEDFSISLDRKKLTISGVRHDSAAKLGYQQMEIQYGYFETDVHVSRAIDEDQVEASYQDGFLSVRLAKAKPRRVPVVNGEESL